MAASRGLPSLIELGFHETLSPCLNRNLSFASPSRISFCNGVKTNFFDRKWRIFQKFRLFSSVKLNRLFTSQEKGDSKEASEDFFETIEELERMVREPSEILEEMNNKLSDRELQLVLLYFSQEGRDSWCALEVFDWLRKENRVDQETMELMISIVCDWVKKIIGGDHDVDDIVGILNDMDCVGLKPTFSMIEKVVSLYWEVGKKMGAVMFVREVLRRDLHYTVDSDECGRGDPTGYLAWKMMADGDYCGAAKVVIEFRNCGLKLDVYSYIVAMTALVKEQNEFSKSLRKLKNSANAGIVSGLDDENMDLIEQYQSNLLNDAICLSDWALEEGGSKLSGVIHERLLAMYTCAGRGLEAEHQLWQMKLSGKEISKDLYNIVLAICASQKEISAVHRLLTGMDSINAIPQKQSLSWLLRGYVKGGHFEDAADTLIKMLDLGYYPNRLDRMAVLQGLRRNTERSGRVEPYLKLCKRLSDMDLIGPCLVYMYIHRYKLWVVKAV